MADCRMEEREAGWYCRDCGAGPYRVEVRRNCRRHLPGLGDAVAWITTKLGIRKCGRCSKRQEALNAAFPFPWGHSAAHGPAKAPKGEPNAGTHPGAS